MSEQPGDTILGEKVINLAEDPEIRAGVREMWERIRSETVHEGWRLMTVNELMLAPDEWVIQNGTSPMHVNIELWGQMGGNVLTAVKRKDELTEPEMEMLLSGEDTFGGPPIRTGERSFQVGGQDEVRSPGNYYAKIDADVPRLDTDIVGDDGSVYHHQRYLSV